MRLIVLSLFLFSQLSFAIRKNHGQSAFLEMQITTKEGPFSCHFERIATDTDMPDWEKSEVSYMLVKGCGKEGFLVENSMPLELRDRFSTLVEKLVNSESGLEEASCPEKLKDIVSIKDQLTEGFESLFYFDSMITKKKFRSGSPSGSGPVMSSIILPVFEKTEETKCSVHTQLTEQDQQTFLDLKELCLSAGN
jgi:hypothetical protein